MGVDKVKTIKNIPKTLTFCKTFPLGQIFVKCYSTPLATPNQILTCSKFILGSTLYRLDTLLTLS